MNSNHYLVARGPHSDDLVNSLLTNSIKVNIPVSDMSRVLTTGDDHEVQETDSGPWPPELASGLRLGFNRRQRLIEFRPFSAEINAI
jgi:hypothetical protein